MPSKEKKEDLSLIFKIVVLSGILEFLDFFSQQLN